MHIKLLLSVALFATISVLVAVSGKSLNPGSVRYTQLVTSGHSEFPQAVPCISCNPHYIDPQVNADEMRRYLAANTQ
jgi:hypothetical protein